MTELAIETSGLRKEYRRGRSGPFAAVDDLALAVPHGGIHGLLGPHGSGKTTTIRMLLGLARPSAGTMRLLGEDVPRRLPRVIDRVGAVVEGPRFSPGISGRRNLTLLARSRGLPTTRVDESIERVGLAGRDHERFRGFSPGMKQRLALAASLLKAPDLLILDEPTNGLDPAEARNVRELIREIGSSGATVLLSSHILAEVQQVCDSVSIISRGRLLSTGAVADLVGREPTVGVRVGVHDLDGALRRLTEAGFQARREGTHLRVDEVEDPAGITRVLSDAGIYVRELVPDRPDLETVFRRLTGDQHPADGPGGQS